MSPRQPARKQRPAAPPYGPRGGLAGASDDFARYLDQPAMDDPWLAEHGDWAGWSPRGVYGRGADMDRTARGDFEPPGRGERVDQDYVEREDHDFGGRDTADWYARHGSNAERQRARRRWQARHAGPDRIRGPEIDPEYHLEAGPRDFHARYRPAARNPAWPDWGHGASPDYGAFGGDYGSSPTREADATFRGLAPAGYRRADARIAEDLHQRLTEDPWVDARAVELQVEDGHVTLSGEVDERAMKHRCEDIVAVCPGVTGISNGIRVRRRAYTRLDQQPG